MLALFFAIITIPVTVASASPLVPGLAVCSTGPNCHYGPVHASYPNYRAVCSREDCNFVAAANWEQVVLNVNVSVSELATEYANAGETFQAGLVMGDLWSYWRSTGIDGFYTATVVRLSSDHASVKSGVLRYGALLIKGVVRANSYVGTVRLTGGTMIAIVDGFTPKGPLIVYQSRTTQMSWSQWNADIRNVWAIATSSVPPVAVTPPTATLSISENSLPPTGGAVTFAFSSQNASTCALSAAPTIPSSANPLSVSCNGSSQATMPSTSAGQSWTFTFTATNDLGQSASASQILSETAPAPIQSSNWSGFVVPSSVDIVTSVSGQWIVPVLNCQSTPNSGESTWVGIGGEIWPTGGTSGVLLQTGIADDCVNGAQQDYGWWEMYPSNPNHEITFTGFPITPGDTIAASVFQVTNGSWETLVSDLTTGLSGIMVTGEGWGVMPIGAPTFTYQGSTANYSYSGGYTAEWVVEDYKEADGSLAPFANYGNVTFTNLRASLATWSLTWDQAWAIVQSGVTLSTPSAVTADGFSVGYTGP